MSTLPGSQTDSRPVPDGIVEVWLQETWYLDMPWLGGMLKLRFGLRLPSSGPGLVPEA